MVLTNFPYEGLKVVLFFELYIRGITGVSTAIYLYCTFVYCCDLFITKGLFYVLFFFMVLSAAIQTCFTLELLRCISQHSSVCNGGDSSGDLLGAVFYLFHKSSRKAPS